MNSGTACFADYHYEPCWKVITMMQGPELNKRKERETSVDFRNHK